MDKEQRVSDWGQDRRHEAQLAMHALMGRLDKEPFAGSRLRAGEIAVEFNDAVAAAAYFKDALLQYLQDLGADVVLAPHGTASSDVNVLRQPPFEHLLIHGTVSSTVLEKGEKAVGQIMEACAEVARVLIGYAIVAAAEDMDDANDRIVLSLKAPPELAGKINLQNQVLAGLARVSCAVGLASEPRVSYLLGSSYGQPKSKMLDWGFPLVEQIYGPNRLRWRDLRSPDFEPGPEAVKAVAS